MCCFTSNNLDQLAESMWTPGQYSQMWYTSTGHSKPWALICCYTSLTLLGNTSTSLSTTSVSDMLQFLFSTYSKPNLTLCQSVSAWHILSYLGRCRTVLTSGCSSYPGVCDGVCGGVGRMKHGSSLAPSLSLPQGNPSRRAVRTHIHTWIHTFYSTFPFSNCSFVLCKLMKYLSLHCKHKVTLRMYSLTSLTLQSTERSSNV